jgi:hypothetical protein
MIKKSLGFFCPDNYLYLNDEKTISFNGVTLKTSYLLSLINDILIKFQLDDDDVEINEFCINLYSKILRNRYGLHYKSYVDKLLDIGFIKLKSNYCAGIKAKTYVLNWFDFDSIKRVKVYDAILLKNSYKEYHRKLNSNSPIDLDIRKRLVEDLESVKINFEKSLAFIDDLSNKNKITSSKYFKNYHSIVNIKENNIYFIFDDWGRLHTNYTVLKKEIRKNYLTIDNEPIIEIDIRNSQPFFLSKIIKFEMNISDPEIKLFVDLVDNGLFYDNFVDKFPNYFTADNLQENRNISKKLVYKVLFGYNGIKSEQSKMFKEIYPKIFDYIIGKKKSEKDYKYFSYKLMRMESDFVFGKVVPDIYKKIKGIKLFTVHDSITYPLKYKEKVEEIFYHHLKNYDNFLTK